MGGAVKRELAGKGGRLGERRGERRGERLGERLGEGAERRRRERGQGQGMQFTGHLVCQCDNLSWGVSM